MGKVLVEASLQYKNV